MGTPAEPKPDGENFATHRAPGDSKLRVIVANLLQGNDSGAGARMRRRCSCGIAALALSCCAITGWASAQEIAELPLAPLPQIDAAHGAPVQLQSSIPALRFAGGVTVEQATPGALALGIDDAIDRGLKRNLQVLLANENERSVRGQISTVFFELLPNMRASGYTQAQEIDLAAMGFKPASLASFGFAPGTIHEIVKVNTTSAQFSADQVLFNLTDFYLYAAAKKAANVVALNVLNVRGGVVQAVGTQYLAALADQAQIANAQALLTADEEVLRQATLAHDAGVGTNLDVLRARVQLQSEQQALVRAQNAFAKDKIALNRLIGPARRPGADAHRHRALRRPGRDAAGSNQGAGVSAAQGPAGVGGAARGGPASQQGGEVRTHAVARLQRILRRLGPDRGQLPRRLFGAGDAEDSHLRGGPVPRRGPDHRLPGDRAAPRDRCAEGHHRRADPRQQARRGVLRRAGEGGAQQCGSGGSGALRHARPLCRRRGRQSARGAGPGDAGRRAEPADCDASSSSTRPSWRWHGTPASWRPSTSSIWDGKRPTLSAILSRPGIFCYGLEFPARNACRRPARTAAKRWADRCVLAAV